LRNKAVVGLLLGTVLLCLFLVPVSKSLESLVLRDYETVIDPDQYPGATEFEKLQNALNHVPPAGALVLLPPKVYEGSNLTIPSKVRIDGANGAVFKLSADANSPFLVIDDRSEVEIERIVFDGNKERITNPDASMVFISHGCEDILIFNNTFRNFRYQAVASSCSVSTSLTRFVIVYRNFFRDAEGAAVLLRGSYSGDEFFLQNVEIRENILYNLTCNGKIGVAFTSNLIVADNQIVSCEAPNSGSIAIRGCKDIFVSKNTLTGCVARAGIFIEANLLFPNRGTFLIENNRVSGQVGGGFSLSGSVGVDAEITLRKNSFTRNSGADIETTSVTIYVYANVVDTVEKMKLSSTTVAWGNLVRFGTSYAFIQSRAR